MEESVLGKNRRRDWGELDMSLDDVAKNRRNQRNRSRPARHGRRLNQQGRGRNGNAPETSVYYASQNQFQVHFNGSGERRVSARGRRKSFAARKRARKHQGSNLGVDLLVAKEYDLENEIGGGLCACKGRAARAAKYAADRANELEKRVEVFDIGVGEGARERMVAELEHFDAESVPLLSKLNEERMLFGGACALPRDVALLWAAKDRLDFLFDSHRARAYYNVRKRVFPQDTHGSSKFWNRAGDKLYEILIERDLVGAPDQPLRFVDLCGGPGAFSQVMLKLREDAALVRGWGITLRAPDTPHSDSWYPRLRRDLRFTPVFGASGDGNVYLYENLCVLRDVAHGKAHVDAEGKLLEPEKTTTITTGMDETGVPAASKAEGSEAQSQEQELEIDVDAVVGDGKDGEKAEVDEAEEGTAAGSVEKMEEVNLEEGEVAEPGNHVITHVVADGGFNVSTELLNGEKVHVEHVQELYSLRIVISEVLAALMILEEGGHFVCKLYDCFSLTSTTLLYAVSLVFESTHLVKPIHSRMGNSERYLVGRGLRPKDALFHRILSILKTAHGRCTNDVTPREILPRVACQKDELFWKRIREANDRLLKKQTRALNIVMDCIFAQYTELNSCPQHGSAQFGAQVEEAIRVTERRIAQVESLSLDSSITDQEAIEIHKGLCEAKLLRLNKLRETLHSLHSQARNGVLPATISSSTLPKGGSIFGVVSYQGGKPISTETPTSAS